MNRAASIPSTVAVAVLVLMPLVPGHGAEDAREIDTRALTDHDPDGPTYDQLTTQNAPGTGGHDLLVLDMRETFGPTGLSGVMFRLIVQGGDPTDGKLSNAIEFEAGGKSFEVGWSTTDNAKFENDGFDWISAKIPVFDDYPFAIDGFLSYATLGVAPGAELTKLVVHGHVGSAEADFMPGGFHINGVEIGEAATPGSYKLVGPQILFNAQVDASAVATMTFGAQRTGNANNTGAAPVANITITSPLQNLEQDLQVNVSAGPGIVATTQSTVVNVPPGATRNVLVNVNATATKLGGRVDVLLVSSLGDRRTVSFDVPSPVDLMPGMTRSAVIERNQSYVRIFQEAGTFHYHNHLKGSHAGVVHVRAADGLVGDPDAYEVAYSTAGFDPANLTIVAGDRVVWKNMANASIVVMGSFQALPAATPDEDGGGALPAPGLWLAVAAAAAAVALRRRNA